MVRVLKALNLHIKEDMMKKYILISSIVAGMLIGCGGGSSSNDENQGSTLVQKTKKLALQDLPTKDGKKVFTREYLNGKTLYGKFADTKKVEKYVFGLNDVTIDTIERSLAKILYEITEEGYVKIGDDRFFKIQTVENGVLLASFAKSKEKLDANDGRDFEFYQDKQEALKVAGLQTESKKVVASDKGGLVESNGYLKATKQWLNGKSFYDVFEEDGEWIIVSEKFSDKKFSGSSKLGNFDTEYRITEKGYINFFFSPDNEYQSIKIVKKTNDYLDIIWRPEGSGIFSSNKPTGRLYFDLAKAKEYIKSKQ